MSAPRSRGVRLAVLAALALAGGTAATLLSSRAVLQRGAAPAPDPDASGPPGGAPDPGPAPPSEARRLHADPAAARRESRVDDSPIPPPPAGASVLVLTARNGDTGKPAAGALVRISQPGPDREARTDAEGFARVERLLPGHSVVRLSSPGRRSAARPLRLVDDEEVRVEMVLHPEATVAGRVVNADGGTPLAGACVRVVIDPLVDEGPWRGLAPDSVWIITGPDGRFSAAAGLPSGQARLAVSAAGFREESLWVRLPADAATPLEIEVRLVGGGTVRGFVRSPEGAPVAGADVVGWTGPLPGAWWKRTADGWTPRPLDPPQVRTLTGADGSYALEGLTRGTLYGVTAQRNNHIFVGGPRCVVVPEAGTATLDLVLGEPGSLRFDLGARGGPPAWLRLRLMPTGDNDSAPIDHHFHGVGGEGSPTASVAVPPGTWGISLTAYPGLEIVPQETVTIVAGRETVISVLDPGQAVASGPLAVSGVVVDASGAGIAGATVHARLADDESAWLRMRFPGQHLGQTDAHGAFRGVVRHPAVGAGIRVVVHAHAAGFAAAGAGVVALPVEGLRVVLSPLGGIRGRIAVPPGPVAATQLGLLFEPQDKSAPSLPSAGQRGLLRFTAFGDGSFLYEGLAPGRGTLEVRTEAGSSGPIPVVVPAGAVLDVGTVEIPTARTIRCRVVAADGTPLAHAAVRVVGEGPLLAEGRTDVDGTCILEGVAANGALVRAAASGWYPQTLPVSESGLLEFRLSRGGRIDGWAFDGWGRPASRWWVVARSREREDVSATQPDVRGAFELLAAPGAYDLELRFAGSPHWTVPDDSSTLGRAEVVVEDGRVVTVEIRASR